MVMPCSRSACSPSTSSAKSMSSPVVPCRALDRGAAPRADPHRIILRSCSRRPIRVDFPSSTEPQVMNRNRSFASRLAGPGLRDGIHQKYPSRFFFSIEATSSLSISRPLPLRHLAAVISAMTSSTVPASDSMAPRQRIASQGAEANAPLLAGPRQRRAAAVRRPP